MNDDVLWLWLLPCDLLYVLKDPAIQLELMYTLILTLWHNVIVFAFA
jgi:hypothetical protein